MYSLKIDPWFIQGASPRVSGNHPHWKTELKEQHQNVTVSSVG
jgi:hypothetical protein